MTEDKHPASEESLITYPCDFPIKVMGKDSDDIKDLATEIIRRHCPHMEYFPTHTTRSSKKQFISVTITIKALSKAQLDAIYQELSEQPWAMVVL